ncbi:MAG: ABC transporter substrate-binding protein, partial [Planctomycetota bacterium]|nr:ABC transporter substrate-binding protein [Planctomycetota bacterium]
MRAAPSPPRRAWIAIALLAVAGCDRGVAPETVLRFPIGAAPDSFDPRRALMALNGLIQRQVLETLTEYDPQDPSGARVLPLLAESWTTSADGLEWNFTLRADARFHDPSEEPLWPGRERAVEAADVVASWVRHTAVRGDRENTWTVYAGVIAGLDAVQEAALAAASPEAADATWKAAARSGVSGLSALDARHLRVRLTQPDGHFLQRLASQAFAVIPRELATEEVRDPRDHAVGSAPFAVHSWDPGQSAVLRRVPGWRGQAAPGGGTAPFVDEVRFDLVRESAARSLMWQDGTLHRISLGPDGIAQFTENGVLKPEYARAGAQLSEIFVPDLTLLVFNMRDETIGARLDDPAEDARRAKLRAALAAAFPRDVWHRLLRGDALAVPARHFLPPQLAEASACADFPYLGPDLAQAAALLAEAGHAGGAGLPELVLDLTGEDAGSRSVGEAYAENLRSLGVRLRAQPNVWSTLMERAQRGEFQMTLQAWTLDWPDAAFLYALFWGGNAGTETNLSQFRDPGFDADWEELRRSSDPARRAELCRRLGAILAARVPALPIDHRRGYLL